MLCDYCKKTGHTKDRCFKLYGFPNSRKNNRDNGKRIAAPVQGNNPEISHILEFNTAQFNKLMDMLNDTPKNLFQHLDANTDGIFWKWKWKCKCSIYSFSHYGRYIY